MIEWEDGMEMIARGHAGHGEQGSDIVCAGVSALLYALVAYLDDAVEGRGVGRVRHKTRDGYLWVRCRGLTAYDASASAVIKAGLRMIAAAYPCHVRFTHSEKKERMKDGNDGNR